MTDTRFIKSIRLRNLLSFGPDTEEFEMKPLNVLIGPNASGKTNFIEAIEILRAAPGDIRVPFHKGGGIKEWLWKGEKETNSIEIETKILRILGPALYEEISLRYFLSFSIYGDGLHIGEEIIENEYPKDDEDFIYRNKKGKVVIKVNQSKEPFFIQKEQVIDNIDTKDKFNPFQSILSQREDPFSYRQLTSLKQKLREIRIFDNWTVGKNNISRIPQQSDLPSDFLLESFSNFALIINDLKDRRETKDLIIEKMKIYYDEFEYLITKIQGGSVQLFIQEKGFKDPIPATRLSDGTLRYLCLLTILCHPEPPPLICIEEPEIGLHPDIMPTIADLLIDASQRTQLIVTTHSDALVSALSETPESVVVCEHDDDGTHMRRLEKDKLDAWLEKYTLGDLWMKGEIGGTRW